MRNKKKYAIVLAGGGAKGAYQIGAWKALRELGIEFCAVSGASVGALNAALFAQNNFNTALELWENLSLEKVVDLPPELIVDGKFHIRKFNFFHLREINRVLLKYGGLDTTPLQNMIRKYVDEDKIRKSGFDLGLVTVNIDRLKPVEIFLDDIPSGKLGDYLLASASFPTFKQTEIDGRKYTDGGVYDNIPYRMIKERGYKKIIIIDIAGPGFNRKPDIEGTETIYIKNRSDIGHVLNFDSETLKNLLNLGYLDTLKTFGKIDGIRYYYKTDKKLEKKLDLLLGRGTEVRKILPRNIRQYKSIPGAFLECAANILGIESRVEYSMDQLLDLVVSEYQLIMENSDPDDHSHHLRMFRNMRKNMKQKYGKRDFLGYPPFEYHQALSALFNGEKHNTAVKTLNLLFPSLPGGLYFIEKVVKKQH